MSEPSPRLARPGDASGGRMQGTSERGVAGRADMLGRFARECASLVAVVGAAALVLALLGIGCPIKFATGVSCPGCGMTRAWLEALQLHFDRAFAYHPLFWLVPLVIAAAVAHGLATRRAVRWACTALMAAGLVACIALWAWRLATPHDLALLVDAAGEGDVVNVASPGWLGTLRALRAALGL